MTAWARPIITEILWDGLRNGKSAREFLAVGCKRCPRCEQIKFIWEFHRRLGTPYATSHCKECSDKHYQDNAEEIREIRRQQRLGVPIGTYGELVEKLGARCSICGTDNPGGKGSANSQFCIDHDHHTGAIRGLLCTQCNVGIGMLRHDQHLLLAAIRYLSQQPILLSEPEPAGIDPTELGL